MSQPTPNKLPYNPSGIGTLFQALPKSLSYLQRKAAARAILRHDVHVDGTHSNLKRPGGLHPSYIALHGVGSVKADDQHEAVELLRDTMRDALDAITMLDRIDGGVTLLIRTAGYGAAADLSIDDITLDIYFPPRELHEGGRKIRSTLAGLIHVFGKDIALPHLQQFAPRCRYEGIRNPLRPPPYGRQLVGENLTFPDPDPQGSSCLRCRCSSSMILKGIVPLVFGSLPPTEAGCPRPSVASARVNPRPSLQLDNPAKSLTNAIVSIGSNTDAALDRFCLDDSLIPTLRALVTTVRSSKWEAKLRGGEWGLSYEQAVTLSNALHADIGIAKLTVQSNRNPNNLPLLVVASLAALVVFYYIL